MKIIRCFALTYCLLFNLSVFAFAGAGDTAARPGQRIGQIKLGASRATVHKLLGKPTKSFQRRDKLRQDTWSRTGMINSDDAIIFRNVIYRAGKVAQIETNDPSYAPEGIFMDIGPSLPSIRNHFKKLHLRAYRYGGTGGYINRYYDDESGIAFSYLRNRDGEKHTPNSIIVHRANQSVIPEAGGRRIKASK